MNKTNFKQMLKTKTNEELATLKQNAEQHEAQFGAKAKELQSKIKENAERSNMSTNSYIIGCCTSQRVPYKHKRQEIGRLYVELAQCCNDSPEIRRKIGGIVCQLRACL